MYPTYHVNAQLDLSFTRIVDVPRAHIWRAWTEPALLMPWFCPLPWKIKQLLFCKLPESGFGLL